MALTNDIPIDTTSVERRLQERLMRESPSGRFWQGFRATPRGGGILSQAAHGAASAFLPIAPPSGILSGIGEGIDKVEGKAFPTTGAAAKVSSAKKGIGSRALGVAGKWFGPITGAYRLGTEVDISSQGLGGAASKTGRIVGEEVIGTAGFAAAAALGGKIGAGLGAIGGTFAVPVPIVGGTVGGLVGGAIGVVAGMAAYVIGGWAWNKAMDVAEAPIRLAHAGWKYFREQGKRSARMELGGMVSRGNRSRMAYTMRSRALQEISRSAVNARSLLGNEGAYHHIR